LSEAQVAPTTSPALFTLGTRGSPLALVQANEARRRLAETLGWEIDRIALQVIRVSGDAIQDRPLAEAGGKGLFTKEIDAALLAGTIDAAVHSAKDLPSLMPEGVVIAAYLPREDVRDALISTWADSIEDLPREATFGAASLRRQAQALRLRPDLKPVLLRGNVETAAQGRVGRGRRDPARARRPEAARPRAAGSRGPRHRHVPARSWAGRDRHHGARGRRAGAWR
jgi:hydroxymethylbilane synthase